MLEATRTFRIDPKPFVGDKSSDAPATVVNLHYSIEPSGPYFRVVAVGLEIQIGGVTVAEYDDANGKDVPPALVAWINSFGGPSLADLGISTEDWTAYVQEVEAVRETNEYLRRAV